MRFSALFFLLSFASGLKLEGDWYLIKANKLVYQEIKHCNSVKIECRRIMNNDFNITINFEYEDTLVKHNILFTLNDKKIGLPFISLYITELQDDTLFISDYWKLIQMIITKNKNIETSLIDTKSEIKSTVIV